VTGCCGDDEAGGRDEHEAGVGSVGPKRGGGAVNLSEHNFGLHHEQTSVSATDQE